MRVTIKRWNAVAAWRWDVKTDDMCGICRSPYDSTCAKCKYPGDECPLLLGECLHTFHMHCILAWTQQESSQDKCPMCRQVFKAKEASGNAKLQQQERGEEEGQEPEGEEDDEGAEEEEEEEEEGETMQEEEG